MVHEKYNNLDPESGYDIALIKTTSPVELSSSVNPACKPTAKTVVGDQLTAATQKTIKRAHLKRQQLNNPKTLKTNPHSLSHQPDGLAERALPEAELLAGQ